MVRIVPLSNSVWERSGLPLPQCRLRGFAGILDDGQVLGFGGVAYPAAIAPSVYVFCEMTDAAQQYPVSIMRIGRKVVSLIEELKLPAVAYRDVSVPRSNEFLRRLGFVELADGMWRYEGCPDSNR